jgi:hypothetical protein
MKYLKLFEEIDPTKRINNDGWVKLNRPTIGGVGDEVINWFKEHTFTDISKEDEEVRYLSSIGFRDITKNVFAITCSLVKKFTNAEEYNDEIVHIDKTKKIFFGLWKADDDWWLIHSFNTIKINKKTIINDRDYFLCDGSYGLENFINSI